VISAAVVVVREWGDDRGLASLAILAAILLLGLSTLLVGVVFLSIGFLIGTVAPFKTFEGALRFRDVHDRTQEAARWGSAALVAWLLARSFAWRSVESALGPVTLAAAAIAAAVDHRGLGQAADVRSEVQNGHRRAPTWISDRHAGHLVDLGLAQPVGRVRLLGSGRLSALVGPGWGVRRSPCGHLCGSVPPPVYRVAYHPRASRRGCTASGVRAGVRDVALPSLRPLLRVVPGRLRSFV